MSSLMVTSGFSPKGYHQYGKEFLRTFDKYWPKEVRLTVFTEQPVDVPRGGLRSLWACPGIKNFIDKHAADSRANGLANVENRWSDKDKRKGYSYRWDAVKFSRQCVIPLTASEELQDGDVLVWLDADVVCIRDISVDFVSSLLGDRDMIYLGRIKGTSEIGFWAVRINPRTREFLRDLAHRYMSEEVFKLQEWHSAYVFDHIRKSHEVIGLRAVSLTPNGFGHVWFQSPLGRYMDHLKGEKRKLAGRSVERV